MDVEREPRYEYTKQDCIGALQEAAEELGEDPTQHSYQRLDILPSAATIQSRFSSWKAAKAETDVIARSVRNWI
ncbi:homing endonuclease associated repeat-containing protein [Halobacterium hubeiense]|uniref:homing endonuclease associated repeat-containing protein n=1 Tax=Halobacterium hubeiense TaxID=1407499 RepID=UPI00351F56E9